MPVNIIGALMAAICLMNHTKYSLVVAPKAKCHFSLTTLALSSVFITYMITDTAQESVDPTRISPVLLAWQNTQQ